MRLGVFFLEETRNHKDLPPITEEVDPITRAEWWNALRRLTRITMSYLTGGMQYKQTTVAQWGGMAPYAGPASISPAAVIGALNTLIAYLSSMAGMPQPPKVAPQPASTPAPSPTLANAPAGKGLTQIGPNSFRTAGGYTITAEGKDQAWTITGPDGKKLTRVWGDPHVNEGDGTKWDFTKSSRFILPDGTIIQAKTTSETGKPFTQQLDIINGADRAMISGIDKNKPSSKLSQDGYEFRAQSAAGKSMDNYYLAHGKAAGTKETVQWIKEQDGKIDGVVTGTVDKNGSYEQITDKKQPILPMDRPPVGSKAWGNYVRGFLTDLLAQQYGQSGNKAYGYALADQLGQRMHQEHLMAEMPQSPFPKMGGWSDMYKNMMEPFNMLSAMYQLFSSINALQSQVSQLYLRGQYV